MNRLIKGYANYEITVLKAARVLMVFEVLGKLGEVIKSKPSVTELEEENFEYSFTDILVSNAEQKEIGEKIYKVSEIENVKINYFSISKFKEE